ncbi:MAG TPA: DUF4097 family beta strand repeat-containing protein [Steroidobacteraceae bacterium]
MMKSYVAIAVTLLAPLALADQPVDKRAPADPQGEVEVSSVAGLVNIDGWDRSEVQITGTLGDNVERLDFVSDPKRTVIKVVMKKRSSGWDDDEGDAELSIRVPAGSRLTARTVSADLSVSGVRGELRLQTVSGELSSEISAEDVEAKSVSGDVVLRGENKPTVITVTTVSGDAHVRRAAGEIVANSVSGSLNLELDQITRARVRTTSGDLELNGELARDARVDAETISGEVNLDFKGTVNAEFEIESFSGEIDDCFGQTAQSTDKHGPGSELNFKQGDGSARVRVQSLSGDIRVCGR